MELFAMIRFALRTFALLCLLALAGCGLNEFDVTQSGSATVPGGGITAGLLNQFPPMQGFNSFDFSQSQEFKNENAQKDHVSSAKLTAFTLNITAPSGGNFGFLQSIAFYAEANGQKVRVAHKENIGSLPASSTLSLDLDDVELAPFVKADTMSITTTATGQQPVSDTQITATAVFHVTVSL
jgi:hypothetical protein